MSSTRSKRRPMIVLSVAAAQRLLRREASVLHGMRLLLPEGTVRRLRDLNWEEPICRAVLRMHYCASGDVSKVKSAKSAYSSVVLIDWAGRAAGSVQFTRTRGGWKLASLTMGTIAKSLHRALNQRAEEKSFDLISVPHLRLILLVIPATESSSRRFQVIQSGLTSLHIGSRLGPESLETRLAEEDRIYMSAVSRTMKHAEEVSAKFDRTTQRTT